MFPILAIFGSAILHPLMASFAKRAHHALTINLWAVFGSTIIFSFVYFNPIFWGNVWQNWFLILISSIFHVSYILLVLPLIANNEFQVVYPLTRIAPIIMTIGEIFLLGKSFEILQLVGIALIVSGALIFGFDKKIVRVRSSIFLKLVLITLFMAGYFLVDKQLVDVFSPAEMWAIISFQIPFLLPIFYLHPNAAYADLKNWKRTLAFTLSMIGTWYLALYALQYLEASVVAALRNFSILFGVLVGASLFKEGHQWLRYLAAILICLGGLFVLS